MPFGFEVGHWMESELFYRITTQAILLLHVNEQNLMCPAEDPKKHLT